MVESRKRADEYFARQLEEHGKKRCRVEGSHKPEDLQLAPLESQVVSSTHLPKRDWDVQPMDAEASGERNGDIEYCSDMDERDSMKLHAKSVDTCTCGMQNLDLSRRLIHRASPPKAFSRFVASRSRLQ